MYILKSLAFMQILLWTCLCLRYVYIILVLIEHTYTLKFIFMIFICFGILSFIAYIHEYAIHMILVHSHYFFTHDIVSMSFIRALSILSDNFCALSNVL